MPWRREAQAPCLGLVTGRSRQHIQERHQVGGAAGDRAEDVDVRLGHRAQVALLRDDPEAGLMPEDAAVSGRVADRAADVRAQFEGGQAGRDRRRRASRGTARCTRQVPRVAGRAEQVVVGLDVTGPPGRVRLAVHDRARLFETPDGGRVCRWHVVRQFRGPAGGTDARGGDGILDRHGQPVQRTAGRRVRRRLVSVVSGVESPLGVDGDDRVERGVDRLDPAQVLAEQLPAGDAPVTYRTG